MVPPNLKEQSGQLAIEGDAVEHLDDTVVREVGVLSVALEELMNHRALNACYCSCDVPIMQPSVKHHVPAELGKAQPDH